MPPRKRKIDLEPPKIDGEDEDEDKNEEGSQGGTSSSASKKKKESKPKSLFNKKAKKPPRKKRDKEKEEMSSEESEGLEEEGELRFKPYAIYRNGQLILLELEGKKAKEIRRILKEAKKCTIIYAAEEANEKGKGGKRREIVTFFGGASPFSNFHPCTFQVDNKQFCSSEQFYHFCKAIAFDDPASAGRIMETNKPTESKRIGRRVQGFDANIWKKISILVMVVGLMRKFQQNAALEGELTATNGAELIEASPFDGIWGAKKSAKNILNGQRWNGKNHLGRILMAIRNHFLGQYSGESTNREEEANKAFRTRQSTNLPRKRKYFWQIDLFANLLQFKSILLLLCIINI